MHALRQRVAAEYMEMPGLSLTPAQATRLWGLSLEQSEALLEDLCRQGVLHKTHRGTFVTR